MAGLNSELELEVREVIAQCELARDYEDTLARRIVALIADRENPNIPDRNIPNIACAFCGALYDQRPVDEIVRNKN